MTVHFFLLLFFFFFFYSFGSPYSSLRRWIFFPWAIWRCLVGWQSERGDKGEEHMMWSKLIWDGKVAWKQREATTKFFCSSVFFQLSFFFFSVSPGSRSGVYLILLFTFLNTPGCNWFFISITAALQVLRESSALLLLAQQWSAVNGVRAFLQRYSKAGFSVWTFTVAVEGVKSTYSLNTFMAFYWGSCLFILDKKANLFSSSVFLCISFTMKLYLF